MDNKYSSKNIKNHQYPISVQKAPAMYIGSTDEHGLFQILEEVIDNIVDEALEGRATTGWISFGKDGIYRVADDGNGIPVGITEIKEPITGKLLKVPTVQAVLSIPHTSGKFDDEAYKVSRGVHGLGVKLTNALSSFFKVTTFSKNNWWTIEFKLGRLTAELKKCNPPRNPVTGKLMKKGTLFEFIPEKKFFSVSKFSSSLLLSWAEIAAYFTPRFKIVISGTKKTIEIHKPGGIVSYIEDRVKKLGVETENKIFSFNSSFCDAVIGFSNHTSMDVRGFTNGLENKDGGEHVNSIIHSLFTALKDFAKSKQKFTLGDIKEGLIGIVNAKLSGPKFSSQTKEKLVDERVVKPLRDITYKEFKQFFSNNKALANRLCERAAKLNELKTKFTLSKKAAASLNAVKRLGLPAKYASCDSRTKVQDRELLIVEGDSAAGSVKEARLPYQCVMPLKGKILNCVSGDTCIRLWDGNLIQIKDLSKESKGIGFNLETQTVSEDNLSKSFITKYVTELLVLSFEDGSQLRCTPDHLILTSVGYVPAGELTPEHDIITV
jgi:DNA gyrase subunit B